ncbi:pentatricopeptide repeat-containing protein At2g29760, chloroplastic-like [Fagus crenata]
MRQYVAPKASPCPNALFRPLLRPFLSSKLLTVSAFSPFSSLDYACHVFDQIPQPNLYSWNTLIRALIPLTAFGFGAQSFPGWESVARDGDQSIAWFRYLYSEFTRAFLWFAGFGVWGMFVKTLRKDVVSWNSMIKAFAQGGFPEGALELFRGMEKENVKPNDVTMLGVLSACTKKLDLEFRRWVCSYIERNEISVNLTLSNVMLGMYMKCGSVEDAKKLFDKMQENCQLLRAF